MTDDARNAQADARKAQADRREGESLARDAEHTKADRNVTRTLVYGVLVMFTAVLLAVGFAWRSYNASTAASDRAVKCIALVLDRNADAWLGVAGAFTTPAVGAAGANEARVAATNKIVLAADAQKIKSAECAGTKVPPNLPTTLPLPTTTLAK